MAGGSLLRYRMWSRSICHLLASAVGASWSSGTSCSVKCALHRCSASNSCSRVVHSGATRSLHPPLNCMYKETDSWLCFRTFTAVPAPGAASALGPGASSAASSKDPPAASRRPLLPVLLHTSTYSPSLPSHDWLRSRSSFASAGAVLRSSREPCVVDPSLLRPNVMSSTVLGASACSSTACVACTWATAASNEGGGKKRMSLSVVATAVAPVRRLATLHIAAAPEAEARLAAMSSTMPGALRYMSSSANVRVSNNVCTSTGGDGGGLATTPTAGYRGGHVAVWWDEGLTTTLIGNGLSAFDGGIWNRKDFGKGQLLAAAAASAASSSAEEVKETTGNDHTSLQKQQLHMTEEEKQKMHLLERGTSVIDFPYISEKILEAEEADDLGNGQLPKIQRARDWLNRWLRQDRIGRLVLDILQSRVYEICSVTPLAHAASLSEKTKNTVLLKREDTHSVFSFKVRGAYNKIAHVCTAVEGTLYTVGPQQGSSTTKLAAVTTEVDEKVEEQNKCTPPHSGTHSDYVVNSRSIERDSSNRNNSNRGHGSSSCGDLNDSFGAMKGVNSSTDKRGSTSNKIEGNAGIITITNATKKTLASTGKEAIEAAQLSTHMLQEEEKQKQHIVPSMVACCSAGNHAQGVAMAAQKLGLRARISMPATAPKIKIKSVERLGGEVDLGGSFEDSLRRCEEFVRNSGGAAVFVHPFDDPLVIAGQGTVGVEIFSQARCLLHAGEKVDIIFVPVGGGGLLAGIAAYTKFISPTTAVIGVEAADSAGMTTSLLNGKVTALTDVGTFADGTAVKRVGHITFDICQELVDGMVICSNQEICEAIKDAFEDLRVILEPAGALSIAGMKKYLQRHNLQHLNVVAVCSGANLDYSRVKFVAERPRTTQRFLRVELPPPAGQSMRDLIKAVDPLAVEQISWVRKQDGSSVVTLESFAKERDSVFAQLQDMHLPYTDLGNDEQLKLHGGFFFGREALRVAATGDVAVFCATFQQTEGKLLEFFSSLADGKATVEFLHYL